jgi:hypothetical protein
VTCSTPFLPSCKKAKNSTRDLIKNTCCYLADLMENLGESVADISSDLDGIVGILVVGSHDLTWVGRTREQKWTKMFIERTLVGLVDPGVFWVQLPLGNFQR